MKLSPRIVTTDAEIDAAIARGKGYPLRWAVAARYDAVAQRVVFEMDDDTLVAIPRAKLQGLESANEADLAQVELLGPGTALYWPTLNVGHSVPGLLDGVFGTRRWMEALAAARAEAGRRGGRSKSPAKAAAARANGAKSRGRPRKKPSPASA